MSTWVVCLMLSAAGGEPEEAEAKTETRRELPAVAGDVMVKQGKIELAPLAAFSFRDSFYRKILVGAEVSWHALDALAVGAWGAGSITRETGALHLCDEAGCQSPELGGRAPGNLAFAGGLELQFSPLYGKVSFLAETFGNFDVHVRLGAALVGYRREGLAFAPGGRAGLGARYFLTRWLALRLDVDDLVYPERVDKNGVETTAVRNQLFVQAGIAFFLGGKP
jgi:outer membrane beta-barrel protein